MYKIIATAEPVDMVSTRMCGDDAVGTAYETAVQRKLEDGTYEVTSHTYYVEPCRTENQPVVQDMFILLEMRGTTICTDPSDPGPSEITSDYVYEDASALFFSSMEEAEAQARKVAEWCADYYRTAAA